MNGSDKMNEVHTSLVALQGRMPKLVKGGRANTGSYSYTYLELDELLETLRGPMHDVGLGVVQETVTQPPLVGVRTRIVHISGQWLETDPLLLPAGGNAQSAGSAITYARRYSLMAMLGIAAEDDDGAQSAPQKAARSESFGEGVTDRADQSPAPTQTAHPADGAGDPSGEAGPATGDGTPPSSDYKMTLWATYVSLCGENDLHIVKTFAKAVSGSWKPADLPDKASEEQLETAIEFAQNAVVPA